VVDLGRTTSVSSHCPFTLCAILNNDRLNVEVCVAGDFVCYRLACLLAVSVIGFDHDDQDDVP
jgi:hypothetical protein